MVTMRIPPRITTLGGVAALLSVLFVGGPVAATATAATTSVGSICYSALPSQAHDTLDLIDSQADPSRTTRTGPSSRTAKASCPDRAPATTTSTP